MPLKPIYVKSPMKELRYLPLRCGNARSHLSFLETLNALAAPHSASMAFRGELIRLACLRGSDPAALPFWAELRALCDDGKEAFDGCPVTQIDTARALWAMFEYTADKAIVTRLLAWCKSLSENWDSISSAVRTNAADLMILLGDIYRVTGRKGVLTLCDLLRRDMLDWSCVLNTFSVQRPMSKVLPREELTAAMEAEEHDSNGFYTRQYLTMRSDLLADGARASLAAAGYSGNRQEGSVIRSGLARVNRWHGTVLGIPSADDTLAGSAPAAALSTASVGAWLEALAFTAEDPSAAEPLALLMANAVPAAVRGGDLRLYQRMNALTSADMADRCYLSAFSEETALLRLLRGVNAACSSAVMTAKNGASINLMLPGCYTVRTAAAQLTLEISGDTVIVRVSGATAAELTVRTPAWSECDITVNGKQTDRYPAGRMVRINRTWQDGDTIRLVPQASLRTVKGHHQALSVFDGDVLLAVPAGKDGWACAAAGTPARTGEGITLSVRKVLDWKTDGDIPADVPVKPDCGDKTQIVHLLPYAETDGRIAVLPECAE